MFFPCISIILDICEKANAANVNLQVNVRQFIQPDTVKMVCVTKCKYPMVSTKRKRKTARKR